MSGSERIRGLEISAEEKWLVDQFKVIAAENGVPLADQGRPIGVFGTKRIKKFNRKDDLKQIFKLLKATTAQKEQLKRAYKAKFGGEGLQENSKPLSHSVITSNEGKLYFLQHIEKVGKKKHEYAAGASGRFKLAYEIDTGNTVGVKILGGDDVESTAKGERSALNRLGQNIGGLSRNTGLFSNRKEYILEVAFRGKMPDSNELARAEEQKKEAFFISILANLKYVHERKLIHRDIKPANMIMDEKTKEVVFIDPGEAINAGENPRGEVLADNWVGSDTYHPHGDANDAVYSRGFLGLDSSWCYGYATDIYSAGMSIKDVLGIGAIPRDLQAVYRKMCVNPLNGNQLKETGIYHNFDEIYGALSKTYQGKVDAAYERLQAKIERRPVVAPQPAVIRRERSIAAHNSVDSEVSSHANLLQQDTPVMDQFNARQRRPQQSWLSKIGSAIGGFFSGIGSAIAAFFRRRFSSGSLAEAESRQELLGGHASDSAQTYRHQPSKDASERRPNPPYTVMADETENSRHAVGKRHVSKKDADAARARSRKRVGWRR